MFSKFNIYPNPSSGLFNLALNSNFKSDVTVALYDTKGKLVKLKSEHINTGSNFIEFNANNLAEGLYLINLTDGKNSISRQIIIR